MALRMIRKYTDEEKKDVVQDITERHGSLDELKQDINRFGCTEPEKVDEYKILEALKEGASYKKEKISDSVSALSSLSPRRIELLEYLAKNEVDSIQKLAHELDRNYKNVYDDLKGLEEGGLVDLKKEGRRKKPVIHYDRLIIDF